MSVKLTSDDRCAIDVVLEGRSQGDGALEHCYGKPAAAIQKRMKAVEKVMSLIAHMPADEPPADLVARTLKFIKKNEHATVPANAERRPAVVHTPVQRHLH